MLHSACCKVSIAGAEPKCVVQHIANPYSIPYANMIRSIMTRCVPQANTHFESETQHRPNSQNSTSLSKLDTELPHRLLCDEFIVMQGGQFRWSAWAILSRDALKTWHGTALILLWSSHPPCVSGHIDKMHFVLKDSCKLEEVFTPFRRYRAGIQSCNGNLHTEIRCCDPGHHDKSNW